MINILFDKVFVLDSNRENLDSLNFLCFNCLRKYQNLVFWNILTYVVVKFPRGRVYFSQSFIVGLTIYLNLRTLGLVSWLRNSGIWILINK